MNKDCLIPATIIMPVYNGIPYIKEQIETILPQLQECDDLLIVDDCSTDDTKQYLKRLSKDFHNRIVFIENAENMGILYNIKFLIINAKSNLIVFADQDDIWMPNKLETIRKSFQDPDLCLLVHDAEYICGNTTDMLNGVMAYAHLNISKSLTRNIMRNGFIGCCMAINRSHFSRETISKIPMVPMHDWFLSSYALLKNKKTKILCQSLIKHRRHAGNLTKSNNSIWTKIKQRTVLVRHLFL
ncbi:glycosyltransferase [Amylibacter sp.]|nr:glycosyltransferase [Amylibacter sp.]